MNVFRIMNVAAVLTLRVHTYVFAAMGTLEIIKLVAYYFRQNKM